MKAAIERKNAKIAYEDYKRTKFIEEQKSCFYSMLKAMVTTQLD